MLDLLVLFIVFCTSVVPCLSGRSSLLIFSLCRCWVVLPYEKYGIFCTYDRNFLVYRLFSCLVGRSWMSACYNFLFATCDSLNAMSFCVFLFLFSFYYCYLTCIEMRIKICLSVQISVTHILVLCSWSVRF